MSSSGLIYAMIVGAWAAYLVPMWLRKQDELNEARPTERFSTALRLLTGRGSGATQANQNRDQADDEPDEPADRAVRSEAVPAEPAPAEPPAERTARAKALARRRRTTTLLFIALTAGVITAAAGGLRYLWAAAVPAALLLAYVTHLRSVERRRRTFVADQRRAEAAAKRVRERSAERARREPAPQAEPAEDAAAADRRALVEQTDHAEWVDQQRGPDRRRPSGPGWEPVPVPLPTYVTAPVAPRATPGLDMEAPDTWSSARSGPADQRSPSQAPAPESRRQQRPRSRTPLFDQYSQPSQPQDRPRAANE